MGYLPYRRTNHGITFYTTLISVDLVSMKYYVLKFAIFGKGGIMCVFLCTLKIRLAKCCLCCPFSDKLRERRNKALEKFKGLGLSQLVLSIVAMAVGAATLAVAAKDPMGFPVFNPGPAVAGVVVSYRLLHYLHI